MDSGWMLMALALPLVAIIGGMVTAGLAMHHRARLKELKIRERIAMIERGLTPPPDFDAELDERDAGGARAPLESPTAPGKYLTAGVILVGAGLGLALLIALTSGEFAVGIGVGGAIVLLGAAFLVNAALGAGRIGTVPNRPRGRAAGSRGPGDDASAGAPDLP